MKFNLYTPGQRVRFISKGCTIGYGEIGTIVVNSGWESRVIAVDWDRKGTDRHDCNGRARSHHGWWVAKQNVEIIR